MSAPLLHFGATVLCAHGGRATPTVPNPRVLVSGQPTVTLAGPWMVAGCPFPPNAGGPCVTGQWVSGTVRVFSGGQPLALQTGQSLCAPTGTPLVAAAAQPRALGT